MAERTKWVARGLRAERPGRLVWADIKEFDNPADADNWLCRYVRENGLSITDFTIVRRGEENNGEDHKSRKLGRGFIRMHAFGSA
jgi:hypothetical protein